MKIKALLAILTAGLLLPLSFSSSGCEYTGDTGGNNDMVNAKILPLDADPPAEFKTATFASG
jgi:hypothetical protein